MSLDIDEFIYVINGLEGECRGEGDPTSIEVYGSPYHIYRSDLIDNYVNNTLREFVRKEKRHSCGNYILTEWDENNKSLRIITSPGYAGGYYHIDNQNDTLYISTTLGDMLQEMPAEDIKLDQTWGSQYIEQGLASLPPQRTPFDNIYRLPPGSIIEADCNGVAIEDYLFNPRYYLSSPSNLASAFSEVGDAISSKDISLMFSGGRDSLVLYLSLRDELESSGSISPVTVDWRPGSTAQGPFEAIPIANALDMDLDIVEFSDGWPTRESPVFENVLQSLSRDLTGAFAPHHALGGTTHVSSDVLAHGQNMDAIAGVDMSGPQSWLTSINHSKSLKGKVRKFGYLWLSLFMKNIQYTDYYMNHRKLRKAYLKSIIPLFKLVDYAHPGEFANEFLQNGIQCDSSEMGTLHSIARKRRPNVIPEQNSIDYGHDLNEWLKNTLSNELDTAKLAKCVKYYTYVQSSNKTLAGTAIGDSNRRVSLLPMWGPISSYFHSRRLGIRDAIHPKRELNKSIKQKTGKTYSQLRYPENERERIKNRMTIPEYRQQTRSPFVDQLLETENKNQLIKVQIQNKTEITKLFSSYLTDIQKIKNQSSESLGFSRCQIGHRILNLSLLINKNTFPDT